MYPIQYIADTNILWKIINNSVLLSGYSNPMKFRGDPWNSREQFPRNSINLFKGIPRKMDFYGNRWRHFHGIPWKCMERFPWNFIECFHGIPWKLCPNPPWNSMEFFSMEMHGQISLEFHGKFSMEINVLILHGIPWRIFQGTPWNSMMEVFHMHGLVQCIVMPINSITRFLNL